MPTVLFIIAFAAVIVMVSLIALDCAINFGVSPLWDPHYLECAILISGYVSVLAAIAALISAACEVI